jgi:hypothetical protein
MPALDSLEWGRLGMLAAGIVVVVLVLLLVTKACGGSSATSKNEAFFTQVKQVLVKSDQAGTSLHDLLRSQQPVTRKAALAKLDQIKVEAEQAVTDATKLKPTKQVESLQPYLLQALSYRVNGLDCLIRRLPGAYRAKPASAGGAMLVPCTQILLASDVIYINSYYAPAGKALQDANVEVQVPTSPFLSGSDPRPARAHAGHGGGARQRRQDHDPAGRHGEHGQGLRADLPGHRHQRRQLHRVQHPGQADDRLRQEQGGQDRHHQPDRQGRAGDGVDHRLWRRYAAVRLGREDDRAGHAGAG